MKTIEIESIKHLEKAIREAQSDDPIKKLRLIKYNAGGRPAMIQDIQEFYPSNQEGYYPILTKKGISKRYIKGFEALFSTPGTIIMEFVKD